MLTRAWWFPAVSNISVMYKKLTDATGAFGKNINYCAMYENSRVVELLSYRCSLLFLPSLTNKGLCYTFNSLNVEQLYQQSS